MKEGKLNEVVTGYKKGVNTFSDVYEAFNEIYHTRYTYLANYNKLDIHEVQATHEDVLIKTLEDYDANKSIFSHFLNRSLKNRVNNLLNRKKTRESNEIPISAVSLEEYDESLLYRIPSDCDTETHFIKKEIGDKQRQLIADMIRISGSDMKIKNVVNKVLSENCNISSAAKHYDICHKTVERRLLKLQKVFNKNSYGDYKDYLTA